MTIELAYVLRFVAAAFTITLAIVGMIKHRPGDPILLIITWWALLAFGYANLTWAVFDAIENWERISGG